MSGLTNTWTELLYASTAVGASLNTFTTEAQLNTNATMGVAPHLPTDFWLPNRAQVGRGIKIIARGVLSTAAAAPTFTFNIRAGTSATVPNVTTTPLIAGTAAFTPGVSLTNAAWRAEVDVFLTIPGASGGLNTTVQAIGELIFGATAPGYAMTPLWGGGASPGTTLIQTDAINYLSFNAACGTSSASNIFALNQIEIFGLN
jgi:hypothetical protein